MSRTSKDEFDADGYLINGFDYENQAWVRNGRYERCGHPENMKCSCHGRKYENDRVELHYDR